MAACVELSDLGIRAEAEVCDVANEQDVVRCTESTISTFGNIDICVANAGYGAAQDPLKMTLEDWRRLLAVNLDGAFLTLRETARHMQEQGRGGKLIAISSITANFGAPKQAHYAAGKAALGGLVRSLAVELARYNIQVNGIEPGWIVTDATAPARNYEPLNKTVIRRTPAHRWGTTEDLEGIAVYLASRASDFHTGNSIRVDGGYSIY